MDREEWRMGRQRDEHRKGLNGAKSLHESLRRQREEAAGEALTSPVYLKI